MIWALLIRSRQEAAGGRYGPVASCAKWQILSLILQSTAYRVDQLGKVERGSTKADRAEEPIMSAWLPSLIVPTPEDGFALAIKLSRVAVKMTQPSDEVRGRLRSIYETDADALIAASQVVATNFATVAAANDYWRKSS